MEKSMRESKYCPIPIPESDPVSYKLITSHSAILLQDNLSVKRRNEILESQCMISNKPFDRCVAEV